MDGSGCILSQGFTHNYCGVIWMCQPLLTIGEASDGTRYSQKHHTELGGVLLDESKETAP